MFKLVQLGHHCTDPSLNIFTFVHYEARAVGKRVLASYWNVFLFVMLLLIKYSTGTVVVCLFSKVQQQGCARFLQFV